jgi:hypothetical protein
MSIVGGKNEYEVRIGILAETEHDPAHSGC